jgi:hypothetical protein
MDEDYSNAESDTDSEEAGDNTFFIPSDLAGGIEVKPGDILEFRVVGKSADGEVEVEHVKKEDDDMHSELTDVFASKEPEEMEEA